MTVVRSFLIVMNLILNIQFCVWLSFGLDVLSIFNLINISQSKLSDREMLSQSTGNHTKTPWRGFRLYL